jgi:small ligand-binding sensory domain FIST
MHPVPAHATGEIVGDVLEAIGSGPTLAVLFVTHPLTGTFDDVVSAVNQMLQPSHLIAITTGGVLGAGSEVEEGSALALWAVSGGSVETFLLPGSDFESRGFVGTGGFDGLDDQEHQALACSEESSGLVLLADVASFDAMGWLAAQNPRLPIAGAGFGGHTRSRRSAAQASALDSEARQDRAEAHFASGARTASNVLYRNGKRASGGALAVAFGPEFAMHTMVSQSCRPVGKPFTVTKAERNVVYAMGGQFASAALKVMVEQCDDAERNLLRAGIHLGVVVNGGLGIRRDPVGPIPATAHNDTPGSQSESAPAVSAAVSPPTNGAEGVPNQSTDVDIEEFGLGDFVVYQVLGEDRNAQAIALTGSCDIGDIVQFHVRDGATANFECQQRLAEAFSLDRAAEQNSYGALLFASASRGTSLFGTEHHDAATIGEYPSVASAGGFCVTQLGPMGDRNGQHQSALTIALIRAADL